MSQEYIEITEKNLSDAITTACQRLSVTSDKLDYIVIDQGKSGFLGIGARPAKIKARVKEAADATQAILDDVLNKAEKKVQKQADKKQQPKKDEFKTKAPQKAPHQDKESKELKKSSAKQEVKKEAVAPEVNKKAEVSSSAKENKEVKDSEKTAEKTVKADAEKREGKKNSRNRRRKPHGNRQKAESKGEQSVQTPVTKPASRKKAAIPQLTDEQIEEVKNKAEVFLKDVFGAMHMEVSIAEEYDRENGVLTITMEGEDMGVLIGKRGQTLDSMQYLVSLVVNKGVDGYIHVKADTENYRERRKKTLENLAKNIAFKVKRTKHSVTLEPMNPYERRIIHSALQGDKFVTTYSEGEEPYRKVVVALKKNNNNFKLSTEETTSEEISEEE